MKQLLKINTLIVLCFLAFTPNANSAMVAHRPQPNLGTFEVGGLKINTGEVFEAIDDIQRAGEEESDAREKSRIKLEEELKEIARQKDASEIGQSEYEQRAARLNKRINNLDRADQDAHELGKDLSKNIQGIVVGGVQTAMEIQKEAGRRQTARELEAVKQAGNIKATVEKWKALTQPQTLVKGGTVLGAVAAGTIGSYYAFNFAFEQLSAILGKPDLLDETSRKSFWEVAKQWAKHLITGQAEEKIALGDVILSTDLDAAIHGIAEEVSNAYISQLPFKNVLLFGPPGTGKTMVARAISYYSGMDYAIFSGANLAQFESGKDINELRKLIRWAKFSPKGVIIFIDEAEAILAERTEQMSDKARKLLNTFLSLTGGESNKIMFIFATNHPEKFDSAVLSRIGQKLAFPLPGQVERLKMLEMYMTKKIRNDFRTFKRDGQIIQARINVAPEINSEFLEDISKKIDGFSGRDINSLINDIRSAAYASPGNSLTAESFDRVLQSKIKQQKQAVSWSVDNH